MNKKKNPLDELSDVTVENGKLIYGGVGQTTIQVPTLRPGEQIVITNKGDEPIIVERHTLNKGQTFIFGK